MSSSQVKVRLQQWLGSPPHHPTAWTKQQRQPLKNLWSKLHTSSACVSYFVPITTIFAHYTALAIGIFGIIHLPLTHPTHIYLCTQVFTGSIFGVELWVHNQFSFSSIYFYIIKKDLKSGLFANFSLSRNWIAIKAPWHLMRLLYSALKVVSCTNRLQPRRSLQKSLRDHPPF